MIDFDAVTEAVRTLVDTAVTVPVTVTTAPATTPRPPSYLVIELPPGGRRTGTLAVPEQQAMYRCRIRAVARSNQVDVARREAQRIGHQAMVAILNRTVPLTGTGWAVTGRELIGDSGVDVDGELANWLLDFELYVTAA